ncbi:MAG: OmpH family outer membrane protein [Hyphomonas sp.]|nr:OmpH family outer membrane protein [Hyphomonas sp.]
MSPLKKLLIAIVFAFSSAAAIAPVASAQGTVVIAFDDARILIESKAGKDLQTKLTNIETQMNNELNPTRTSLQNDAKTLDTKLNGKTREQVAADTTLVNELKAYQTKANDFANKNARYAQEYSLTERAALIEFNKAVEPVLLEVIREKNAQLVVKKSDVVFSADTIDVTSSMIAKLDAKSPTLNVVRQRIPEKPAQ